MLPDAPLTDGVVTLRRWVPDDAGWYAAQVGDPEIQRFTTEPPELDEPTTRAAIERVLAKDLTALVMTDTGTGDKLGNIALDADGQLSYWVAAPARGRGVGTRAVRLLSDWALASGVDRIALHTRLDNVASQRAAEGAGFRRGRTERAARQVKGETWDIVWFDRER